MLIDTHCHIYKSEMENACEIIDEALSNDIHLIVNGTDPSSNMEVLDLASRYDNVHAALGYYPSFADVISDEDISLLDDQLCDGQVVAVGEIGLDYYNGKENRDTQIELFDKMLGLAEKHDLPAIVHSRNAMQDTYDVLKRHDVAGSMHCYQGSPEMAKQFIKLGFYIGVGGTLTHAKNRKAKNTVREIGIAHIVVETDSPYLAPEEKRGEINTPLNLKYVTGKLAEELDMSEEQVICETSKNAMELFEIVE